MDFSRNPQSAGPESRAHFEKMYARGKDVLDLTIVFHQHGGTRHAEESVSHIADNSLVFIEGMAHNHGDPPFFNTLNMLNSTRLSFGSKSPEYRLQKALALEELLAESYRPAYNYNDFTQHSAREIQLLIEKDCFVNYADFNASPDPMHPEPDEEYIDHVLVDYMLSNNPIFFAEKPERQPMGTAINNIVVRAGAEHAWHWEREKYAVRAALTLAGLLDATGALPDDIQTTSDNRILAYMTYGTGHHNSLTHRFEENGVTPRTIIVEPAPKHAYLEKSLSDHQRNFSRRVAHSVLSNLAVQVYGHRFYRHIEDLYDNMEPLNSEPDGLLKMLIRCIQIQYELSTNPRKAIRDTQSTLRPYLPQAKFLPLGAIPLGSGDRNELDIKDEI